MNKPAVPALVVVDWIDSVTGHHQGQMEQQDAAEFTVSRCMTVGFLLFEDDARVVLGFTRFDRPEDADYTPDYRDVLAIPKVVVLSMRVLHDA